jgi:hypothetical protein
MGTFYVRLTLIILTLLQFSATVFAGPLDDYYLQQFGEASSYRLQKAILSVSADVQESAHCGMPLKHGLGRDWNLLEQTTQKVLAKQLASPALSGESTALSSGGHFTIHYATTSAPVVCTNSNNLSAYGHTFDDVPTPQSPYTLQSWIKTVGDTFEYAYDYYSSQGYRLPPNFPATPYNVYLRSLVCDGNYGVTENIPSPPANYPYGVTSWIELDSSFTNSIFHPGQYTPLQSLQITSAHEFHHAIQYGYNYYFDIWYAEVTSTWFEDEVYPTVNQNYSYIKPWFQNSTKQLDLAVDPNATSTGAGYGRWIFNRYLAENHTTAVVRSFWESLAGIAPTNGQDIPMTPVLGSVLTTSYNSSLSAEFFKFAKRVYLHDWPITPTITSADISLIPTYSPVATYTVYPVNSGSSPTPSVTLPHYSFAYYRLVNSPGVTSLKITITKTPGIQTALFKNAAGTITEIAGDVSGTSYSVSSFVSTDELILLIANTTSTDGENANFSTDGTTVPTTPMPVVSGSSNHCFIATAAYGSYLHPQVQLLRDFRDEYLLTNAPGRAFVAFYYRHSPPLADFIARHAVLRGVARLALTPVVTAVAHPLISAATLLLLVGALLMSLLRRIKTARSNAHPHLIRTT